MTGPQTQALIAALSDPKTFMQTPEQRHALIQSYMQPKQKGPQKQYNGRQQYYADVTTTNYSDAQSFSCKAGPPFPVR
jgi:hypothetical protein